MRDFPAPSCVGEEAVVADSNHASGEHMQEEAPEELKDIEGHELFLVPVGAVLPSKGHLIVLEGYEAFVGDRDAMGVSTQVPENLVGSRKGRL